MTHTGNPAPVAASKAEWLAAHERLLAKEKAATRAHDALVAERRMLPRLKIEKEYVFDGPQGKRSLADLFEGRPQLVLYSFMFAPSVNGWPDAGCPGCSFLVSAMFRICMRAALRLRWCRSRRWRISTATRSAWAGRCPGIPRRTTISTATSA
jgi:predicted dithiol-disulfide oxidoreductase (DUF899 family)